MRKLIVACVLLVGLGGLTAAAAPAPQKWKDWLEKARQQVGGQSAVDTAALSQSDMVAGLREALATGTTRAIKQLGRPDGFWGNQLVRIPLPGPLQRAGDLARRLGQGKKVDAFQLSLNRAAEKAVPQVADIFGDAIRRMSLDDARKILGGGDTAATDYFRRVAGQALAQRIHPIVAQATDSVGVTERYKAFMGGSRGQALGSALSLLGENKGETSTDLDQYVTDKTLDGLFATIGREEKAIRHDPAARTTALLKKVFGGR